MTRPDVTAWVDVVRADLYRYGEGTSLRSFASRFVRTPGFRYTLWLRLSRATRRRGIGWRALHYLCRFALHRCGSRFGISIPYDANVGAGLYIGHWGGIVVHPQAVIGDDCNVNHGVTIGAKYGGRSPGVPVIGDRVYLGPGCTVIGSIRIGDDAAIGANSVVLASVPPSGVAAGVPARVVSLRGSGDYVVRTARSRAHVAGAADRPLEESKECPYPTRCESARRS